MFNLISYVAINVLRVYWIYEVGSEVNKPSKILIKILNPSEYIESNIQNFKAQRTNDPII